MIFCSRSHGAASASKANRVEMFFWDARHIYVYFDTDTLALRPIPFLLGLPISGMSSMPGYQSKFAKNWYVHGLCGLPVHLMLPTRRSACITHLMTYFFVVEAPAPSGLGEKLLELARQWGMPNSTTVAFMGEQDLFQKALLAHDMAVHHKRYAYMSKVRTRKPQLIRPSQLWLHELAFIRPRSLAELDQADLLHWTAMVKPWANYSRRLYRAPNLGKWTVNVTELPEVDRQMRSRWRAACMLAEATLRRCPAPLISSPFTCGV